MDRRQVPALPASFPDAAARGALPSLCSLKSISRIRFPGQYIFAILVMFLFSAPQKQRHTAALTALRFPPDRAWLCPALLSNDGMNAGMNTGMNAGTSAFGISCA